MSNLDDSVPIERSQKDLSEWRSPDKYIFITTNLIYSNAIKGSFRNPERKFKQQEEMQLKIFQIIKEDEQKITQIKKYLALSSIEGNARENEKFDTMETADKEYHRLARKSVFIEIRYQEQELWKQSGVINGLTSDQEIIEFLNIINSEIKELKIKRQNISTSMYSARDTSQEAQRQLEGPMNINLNYETRDIIQQIQESTKIKIEAMFQNGEEEK